MTQLYNLLVLKQCLAGLHRIESHRIAAHRLALHCIALLVIAAYCAARRCITSMHCITALHCIIALQHCMAPLHCSMALHHCIVALDCSISFQHCDRRFCSGSPVTHLRSQPEALSNHLYLHPLLCWDRFPCRIACGIALQHSIAALHHSKASKRCPNDTKFACGSPVTHWENASESDCCSIALRHCIAALRWETTKVAF